MSEIDCNLLIVMLVMFPVQKREARVVERWKKIVRGALIRERVQKLILLLNDVIMCNFVNNIAHAHIRRAAPTTNKVFRTGKPGMIGLFTAHHHHLDHKSHYGL